MPNLGVYIPLHCVGGHVTCNDTWPGCFVLPETSVWENAPDQCMYSRKYIALHLWDATYMQCTCNARCTCPNAERLLLMAAASTSLIPDASLREILSDPARSTRVNLPLVVALETTSNPSTLRKNRRWERELHAWCIAEWQSAMLCTHAVRQRKCMHVLEVIVLLSNEDKINFTCQ